eukprot:1887592-Amphidinium_carterae.1
MGFPGLAPPALVCFGEKLLACFVGGHEIGYLAGTYFPDQIFATSNSLARFHCVCTVPSPSQGGALELASDALRNDRDIVTAAVGRHPEAIEFAADVLLEDDTFLGEVKESVYLFRVVRQTMACLAL